MATSELDLARAHKDSIRNRERIEQSKQCGCFYCLRVYPPSEIVEWTDDRVEALSGKTAICPYCGIDSVLGDSTGIVLSPEFLNDMYSHWFEPRADAVKGSDA